jgi:hypothetical protein
VNQIPGSFSNVRKKSPIREVFFYFEHPREFVALSLHCAVLCRWEERCKQLLAATAVPPSWKVVGAA